MPQACGAPMTNENGTDAVCARPRGHSSRPTRLSRNGHDPVRREIEWRVDAEDVYDDGTV